MKYVARGKAALLPSGVCAGLLISSGVVTSDKRLCCLRLRNPDQDLTIGVVDRFACGGRNDAGEFDGTAGVGSAIYDDSDSLQALSMLLEARATSRLDLADLE